MTKVTAVAVDCVKIEDADEDASMAFTLTFWGVRGTIACPTPSHMGFGGHTSCVEVRCGEQRIMLDAGTGSRVLGKRMLKDGVTSATLLLSHTHLDHIAGFPFFAPAYSKGFTLRVVSGHLTGGLSTEAVMARQMERPLFPVPMRTMGADLRFEEVEPGGAIRLDGDVVVRTAALNHPDGATGYRIEYAGRALCYVTDTEHIPGHPDASVLSLIRDADLVIYDSTYTEAEFAAKIGWGHSTWEEGVRLCRAAGARGLALFHHDPDHDDMFVEAIERDARSVWADVFAAREGMTVTLA